MIPSRRSWLVAAPVLPLVTLCALGFRAAPTQPAAPKAETSLFSRHVQAVFSWLGCNAGESCPFIFSKQLAANNKPESLSLNTQPVQ